MLIMIFADFQRHNRSSAKWSSMHFRLFSGAVNSLIQSTSHVYNFHTGLVSYVLHSYSRRFCSLKPAKYAASEKLRAGTNYPERTSCTRSFRKLYYRDTKFKILEAWMEEGEGYVQISPSFQRRSGDSSMAIPAFFSLYGS